MQDWKSCKAQLEKIETNLLSNEDEYVVEKTERIRSWSHFSYSVRYSE